MSHIGGGIAPARESSLENDAQPVIAAGSTATQSNNTSAPELSQVAVVHQLNQVLAERSKARVDTRKALKTAADLLERLDDHVDAPSASGRVDVDDPAAVGTALGTARTVADTLDRLDAEKAQLTQDLRTATEARNKRRIWLIVIVAGIVIAAIYLN